MKPESTGAAAVLPKVIATKLKVEEGLYLQVHDLNQDPQRKLIRGISHVLDEKSAIYRDYCCSNTALKEVTFAFDHLVIAAPCTFPGIDVRIFVRYLEFKNDGVLNLSGVDHTNTPTMESIREGKHGGDSGNLDLYIEQINYDPYRKTPTFLLKGGGGQNAQHGKDGSNGSDGRMKSGGGLTKTPGSFLLNEKYDWDFPAKSDFFLEVTKHTDWKNEIWKERDFPIYQLHFSHEGKIGTCNANGDNVVDKATSGSDATPPGRPGNGGHGGKIISNTSIPSNLFEGSAGKAGKKAPDAKGGKRGNPEKSAYYSLKAYNGWGSHHLRIEQGDIHTVVDGKDAPAPGAIEGKPGTLHSKPRPREYWLHPALVDLLIAYARDLYLAGQLKADGPDQGAATMLAPILKTLEKLLLLDELAEWLGNRFMSLHVARQTIIQMLEDMASGRDYFGNLPGYMPAVSYAAAREFYKRELDDSLFIVLASRQLSTKYHSATDRKELLSKLISAKNKEITKAEATLKQAAQDVADIGPKLKTLDAKIDKTVDALRASRDRVLEEAKSDVKRQEVVKLAFRLGAAACKVIPVGQPMLGIVGGTALNQFADTVMPFAAGKEIDWSNRFGQLSDSYKGAKETFDTHKGMRENGRKIQDLTKKVEAETDRIKNLDELQRADVDPKTLKELKDAQKAAEDSIDGARGRLDQMAGDNRNAALSQAIGAFSKFKVDEADVKAAFENLAQYDAQMRRLAQEANVLNTEKATLVKQFEEASLNFIKADTLISAETLQIITLHAAKMDFTFNDGAMRIIQEASRRAMDSIYFYNYLLVKAYEAHFLTPFDGEVGLKDFIRHFDDILAEVTSKDQSFVSVVKQLKEKRETLATFLMENAKLLYEDIKISLQGQQEGPWTLSVNKEGLDVLNQAGTHADLILDIADYREQELMDRQYNTRLISISLTKLAFVAITPDGKEYDLKSFAALAGAKIDGTFSMTLHARQQGLVRRDDTTVYALNPEFPLAWHWEYNFKKGEMPKNMGLVLQDTTMEHYLNEKHNLKKEEIIAAHPMHTKLELACIALPRLSLQGQAVTVQLQDLDFDIDYACSHTPIKSSKRRVSSTAQNQKQG
jgi:hypothetical protein